MSSQNKKKSNLVVPVLSAVLLGMLLLYQFGDLNLRPVESFLSGGQPRVTFTPSGPSVSYDYDSQPFFYSNGSGSFYFATKDGISYITADGQTKWNYIYSLSQPVAKTAKDVIAISEIKGRSVHVFNANGRLYSKEFEQPILHFSVSRTGYLVIQLNKGTDYETKAYDQSGELVFEYRHQDYNTYPITSDISGDGRIVASNILEVGGLQMTSNLTFSYIYGNTRSAFAARQKDNQLISATKFIENNHLISVSDSEIAAYVAGEGNYLRDIASVELNNKLSYFGFMGERGFCAVLGQGFLNKPAEPENTVKMYNSSAAETGSYNLNKPATYFQTGENAVIVGSYSSYYAISEKGALLWEYTAPGDIRQMIFLGNTDTILIAYGTEAVVCKRAKGAADEVLDDGLGEGLE